MPADHGASARPFNVLFLCTGNSARSIMAASVLERLGDGRFRAYSAGSHPKGAVHPKALELLQREHYPTGGLRSKSWDEFGRPGAPEMDFVFTVCDDAADELCPVWPGQPVSAHWSLPDPAAVTGSDAEQERAFTSVLSMLCERIGRFVNLSFSTLDEPALRQRLQEIGGLDESREKAGS